MGCGRSVTQLWLQPKILPQGCRWPKNMLIRLNGYPKPYPKVVHTPIDSWWLPRGGLDSEFPSPRTPAHDRQGLALRCRYGMQFGPRQLLDYSQLTYTCTNTRTHTYICMHTHIYIHACTHKYAHPYALRLSAT